MMLRRSYLEIAGRIIVIGSEVELSGREGGGGAAEEGRLMLELHLESIRRTRGHARGTHQSRVTLSRRSVTVAGELLVALTS
jgi:hypothetical protein